MMALMSIKPEYAVQIFSGTKKFEFRRRVFKKDVDAVIVYASAPMKGIIGHFTIHQVHFGAPKVIWKKCHAGAGISQDLFFKYFENVAVAYAIEVGSVVKYPKTLSLRETYDCRAPQSYCYVDMLPNYEC